MKNSWLCRDYEQGDEYQILSLYKQVSGKEMSLAYWKWRYIENPFGKGIIKLMFDEDKLIGHYAVTPMNIQVQNTVVKGAFSMNTMTHPDYGGQEIFTYLARETYKECEQKRFKIVYGFPNQNSYHGFTQRLNWQGFGNLTILQKQLESVDVTKKAPAKEICQIGEFDETVDSLWDSVKQDYRVIVPRTKGFLNWRFVKNPAIEYPKYTFINSQREVLGYIVLKTYSDKHGTKGHIIDMLSIEDAAIVRGLLECAYSHFHSSKIHHISCWMPEDSFYAHILRQEGYARESTETNFGLRILDKQDRLLRKVEHIESWHLTMGDSDAF